MSNDTRQASGGSVKAKRRYTDADEDGRQNAADDYTSHPKRQRVSRACDSCRSKKDKCDGVQPVCSTCASLCRPCTYKANPKKRGVPTGYIRTLELLWGIVFCKIQGSEEVVRALLRAANIPSHLATMGKEAEGSDTLLSSWKNSIVLREIERILAFLDQPEEEQEKANRVSTDSPQEAEGSSVLSSDTLEWQIPEGFGDGRETSLPAAFSPVKTPKLGSTTNLYTSRATRDSGTQTLPSDDVPTGTHGPLIDEFPQTLTTFPPSKDGTGTRLELPSNAWSLLDIYFSYTQCWFPILEKHDILRTAFRDTAGEMRVSSSSPGSGDYAALWAVLTFASIQEASITNTRQFTDLPSDRPDPEQLYATARSLIPLENGVYEIGHVQAIMLLSLVKFGQQEWTAAWMLVGQAVRISRSLGIDHPPAAIEEGKPAARSKHVFLGCFILETLIATKTGQVPTLRKEDLMRVGPVNEDGLEEWHPWEDQTGLRPTKSSRDSFHRGPLHALSTFNRLVSLVSILNELCCLKQNLTYSIPQLELLERQLQLWVTALPKSYRVDLQTTKLASPHIFGLEMMYEGIVTCMSLQFAMQEGGRNIADAPCRKRAIESSKRSLLLLQTYMENYSLSATSPTFGMMLTFGLNAPGEGAIPQSSSELEYGLKSKLQTFSSHLTSVWSAQGKPTAEMGFTERDQIGRQDNLSTMGTPEQSTIMDNVPVQSSRPRSDSRRLHPTDEARTGLVTSSPFMPDSWMRTAPTLDENASLSIPTPTPTLTSRTSEASRPPPPLNGPASGRLRPSLTSNTKPMNGAGAMIPDIPSPFPSTTEQYPPAYSDPNLNLESFVDIDGYGPPRRPRIAPDLDALFDELASLDGTEKTDNQPEFMQNLGFVPDAGIPELYSYSSQVEPFLLAQTQQLSCSEPAPAVRRESQQTNSSSHAQR
ncbi:hypothetical protein ASPWEDRAFT_506359 [Aspergillus wentii DTO 134E9]|uniref:Zn(2)-C6 fungal-type domain-containing protein n=1 Tax=Aspergillus wentii DTO 134E9 TaxID=1073089 RepID=A0A1L9RK70_ASPWE|nr:uncharacterized protein ASPWEDRAFT_506359 [Aspergillus wentii DTO 134E9]KAI9924886.1 hypothetical protein MW887_006743 [Aspergillus wentii]OJJ35339.1 hypothetical protein ASPWEDRAFT_506359 [Aspergillus wentii DTO 134E9]